jgi:Zn-dependent protease with chaperone function
MTRRVDRGLLALVPALLAFLVFGALRVVAPIGLIGLIWDEPVEFALFGLAVGLAGSVLLFVPAVERAVGRVIAPSRPPTAAETARVEPMLARIGQRAGIRTDRLTLGIEDDREMNASAGAAHLLFVTTGALDRDDVELEALLAHEVGHHRGLHPLGVALLWWLSLPGLALAAVYGWLRRLAERLTRRARPLAWLARLALFVWQVAVMWLYFIAQLFAFRAARVSEYSADHAAASWGYGTALAGLLTSLGPSPGAGRLERLTATHPPVEARVERLAADAPPRRAPV